MGSSNVKQIFADSKAIITGDHFVYAKKEEGWFHGPDYVNKDAIYLNPGHVSSLCAELVSFFQDQRIDVIVGPTIGAVSLSQWTTHWMKKVTGKKHVVSVFADEVDVIEKIRISKESIISLNSKHLHYKANGSVDLELLHGLLVGVTHDFKVGTKRILKRGYDKIVKDKNCLVVEDIINSGATVIKTCDEIIRVGGRVVGVGALCNRSGGKVTAKTLNVPLLYSLLNLEMIMYPEETCPLCKKYDIESVRTDLGKGYEFLLRKNR